MLQRAQQIVLGLVEEIESLDAMPVDFLWGGQFVQATRSRREIVEGGKKVEVAAITAQQNLAQSTAS
ncbi:MAG: hypothetical protein IPH54_12925 [Rhodoferax sp.]|nr:hypothetical protein [Rhodoferax sp.]